MSNRASRLSTSNQFSQFSDLTTSQGDQEWVPQHDGEDDTDDNENNDNNVSASTMSVAGSSSSHSPNVTQQIKLRQAKARVLIADNNHPDILQFMRLNNDGTPVGGCVMKCFDVGRSTTSDLDLCGIRVKILDPGNTNMKKRQVGKFLCLHPPCGTDDGVCPKGKTPFAIGNDGGSGNGAKHMRTVHKVTSTRAQKMAVNEAEVKRTINQANPGFIKQPDRFASMNLAYMTVDHSISFQSFNGNSWNLLARHYFPPNLQNHDIRKMIVQLYYFIKEVIKQHLEEAKFFFGNVAFVCLNLDLYKNHFSNEKYGCIRVAFYHPTSNSVASYNLGCVGYNPTVLAMANYEATKLLVEWATPILAEYDLSPETHILTASCDRGSDVWKTCGLLARRSEWCLSHMENRALLEAFGTQIDPKKSSNGEARAVFTNARSAVESVNKSDLLKKAFEEEQTKVGVRPVKLKNSPHHRWGNSIETLYQLLKYWTPLKNAFNAAEKMRDYPFDEADKEVIVEFHSLLVLARYVQVSAQKVEGSSLMETYGHLIEQWRACREGQHLIINCPKEVENSLAQLGQIPSAGDDNETVTAHSLLKPVTKAVKKKTRQALNKRYFDRFHPIRGLVKPRSVYGVRGFLGADMVSLDHLKFSMVYELLLLLHPKTNGHKMIKKLCNEMDVTQKEFSDIGYKIHPSFCQHDGKVDVGKVKRNHCELITESLKKEIKQLVISWYAAQQNKDDIEEESQEETVLLDISPPKKKQKKLTCFDDSSEDDSIDNGKKPAAEKDPSEKAEQEWQKFMFDKKGKIFQMYDDEKSSPVEWWSNPQVVFEFPALSRVALGFYSMLPGSGGLENDIGGIGHLVSQKRASLSQGMAEAMMLVKLNKKLRPVDVTKVPELGSKWKESIPNRKNLFEKYTPDHDELVEGYGESEADSSEAEDSDDENILGDDETAV